MANDFFRLIKILQDLIITFSKTTITILQISSIILFGIIIYSNSFDCSFHFDEEADILNNKAIREISNVKAWWNYSAARPLSYMTLALNYHFHKYNIWGYHLVNLIVHIINALLVMWLILLILTTPTIRNSAIAKHKCLLAFLAGLLFISHPVQTQAVTYIIQRMASMATLCYLLSIVFYLKGRLSINKSNLFFGGALISAIAGMLFKQITFTLPFAIFLFEFAFFHSKKFNINFKDKKVLIGSLLILAIIIIIPANQAFRFSLLFREIVPQQGNTYTLNGYNYLLTQFTVLLKYIKLLFIPIDQSFDYDIPISNGLLEFRTLLSLTALLIIILLAIKLFKKYRLLSIGIFWFFLTLAVESSIIPIPNVMFEHRLYLSNFGFVIFTICSIFYLLYSKDKTLFFCIILTIILTNSILTYERNKTWKNDLSLWTDAAKTAPRKARTRYNKGLAFHRIKKYDKAISEYQISLEANPDFISALNNLGSIYLVQGKYNDAIPLFTKVLEADTVHRDARNNRGIAYLQLAEYDKALFDFEKLIKQYPDFNNAYKNRAKIYLKQKKYLKAMKDHLRTINLDPNEADGYFQRGLSLVKLKMYQEAISDFDNALKIAPDHAISYFNKGICYYKLTNYDEAITNFTKAINLNPGYAKAYYNRSISYAYHKKMYKPAWDDVLNAKKYGYAVEEQYYQALAQNFKQ